MKKYYLIFATLVACLGILFIWDNKSEPIEKSAIYQKAFIGIKSHASLNLGEEGYGTSEKSGLIVDSIEPNSPASKAHIMTGDLLIKIDNNRLISVDDLQDYLMVNKPGKKAVLIYIREGKKKKNAIVLGSKESKIATSKFHWDYAGLNQLSVAQEQTQKEGKKIFVGLFGSET